MTALIALLLPGLALGVELETPEPAPEAVTVAAPVEPSLPAALEPAAAALVPALPAAAAPTAAPAALPAAVARPAEARPTAAAELRGLALAEPEAAGERFDVTAEYRAARAAPSDVGRLRDYKVLFVPGFMSGAFIRLSRALGKDTEPWHYFGRQMRWLSQMGVEHELVGVHTEQTPEHNAPLIVERIKASRKPVILVTHSNGGPHALQALLTLRASGGLERVAGWIPAQAPFSGSPVADRVMAHPGLRFWISRFLEHPYIGGSRRTVARMTTPASERFYQERRQEIAEVLSRVPTIAFTSMKEVGLLEMLNELTRMGLSLHPLLNPKLLLSPRFGLTVILKGVGATLAWLTPRSDGLVPAESGRVPGMRYVQEDGVDHFVPFVGNAGAFDRLEFTRAMLELLLRRIPAK